MFSKPKKITLLPRLGISSWTLLTLTALAVSTFFLTTKTASASSTYPFGDEVVLYHFEDGAGSTAINSGTGGAAYNGAFVGAAATTASLSKFGSRSAVFGDSNDYLKTFFGTGINPTTNSVSVSLWVYKGGNGCSNNDDHVFGVGSPTSKFYIRCKNNGGNKWDYRIQNNPDFYSTSAVSTSGWDNLVLVADAASSKAYFYVNGNLVGSGASYTSFSLPGQFYVGNYNDTNNGTLTDGAGATIDEVAIYNRALSQADVTSIYNANPTAVSSSGGSAGATAGAGASAGAGSQTGNGTTGGSTATGNGASSGSAGTSITTTTGDFNITHLTNIVAGLNMAGEPNDSSGAAYVPTTRTIFIPHNGSPGSNSVISEIDTNGTKVNRSITCLGCGDIEGITLISSLPSATNPGTYNHTFMLSTENNTASGQIIRVVIPSTGNVTVNANDYFNTGITHKANKGLEGIAYNPASNVFYVERESDPMGLYQVSLGGNHTTVTTPMCSNLTWPSIATDFSDLAYHNGILYILTEDTNPTSLFSVNVSNPSACTIVDANGNGSINNDSGDYLRPIPIGSTDQGEGVTWDDTGTYLYVIGEDHFFSKYRSTALTSVTTPITTTDSASAGAANSDSAANADAAAAQTTNFDAALYNTIVAQDVDNDADAAFDNDDDDNVVNSTVVNNVSDAAIATNGCSTGASFNIYNGQRCAGSTAGNAGTFVGSVGTGSVGSAGSVVGTSVIQGEFVFTSDLSLGKNNSSVRSLQQYLNTAGFAVAASGVGSPGKESNVFGPATKAALIRFQAANGITPASGFFGPLTRSFINTGHVSAPNAAVVTAHTVTPSIPLSAAAAYIAGSVTGSGSSAAGSLTETLSLGSAGSQVKLMRTILRNAGYFAAYGSAHDVPASAATETDSFGATTEAAVKKFQCDKQIVCTGDAATTGWGKVGASTRTALNSLPR